MSVWRQDNDVKRITALADVPGENGRNVTAFDILQMLRFSADEATWRRPAPGIENKYMEVKTQFIAAEVLSWGPFLYGTSTRQHGGKSFMLVYQFVRWCSIYVSSLCSLYQARALYFEPVESFCSSMHFNLPFSRTVAAPFYITT